MYIAPWRYKLMDLGWIGWDGSLQVGLKESSHLEYCSYNLQAPRHILHMAWSCWRSWEWFDLIMCWMDVNLREQGTGEGIQGSISGQPGHGNTGCFPRAHLLTLLWAQNLKMLDINWKQNVPDTVHWRPCQRRQRCPRWGCLAGRRESCAQGIEPDCSK